MCKTSNPLIILTGPTAAGKTSLSLSLAEAVGGEIVSADSMQVYRGMDIGTAKIRPEETRGIPHHLIDVCDPTEDYNVARFVQEARRVLPGIYERGHVPVLAGGTGYYIQALLYGIDFAEEEDTAEIRAELMAYAGAHGAEALHRRLAEIDPDAAEAIHPNNVKRVVRALEYHAANGGRISEHNRREREKEAVFQSAYFVLTMDRARLYERIDRRVEQMFEEGLADEVRGLLAGGLSRGAVSMQGLGYKETAAALCGEMTMEEAKARIQRDTRHFAKRQLTWFRRERDVIWLDKDSYTGEEALLAEMLRILREKGIISR